MKNTILNLTVTALILASCGENKAPAQEPEQITQIQAPAEVAVIAAPDHNYSMKDGQLYGYEPAVSENLENAGQVAAALLMFKYSGQKDGVYQVYMKESAGLFSVIECSNPCEFLKIMTYEKPIGVTNTQHMRAVPGTLGYLVMEDAINGKLESFVGEDKKGKYTMWLDQKSPTKKYL